MKINKTDTFFIETSLLCTEIDDYENFAKNPEFYMMTSFPKKSDERLRRFLIDHKSKRSHLGFFGDIKIQLNGEMALQLFCDVDLLYLSLLNLILEVLLVRKKVAYGFEERGRFFLEPVKNSEDFVFSIKQESY